MEQLNVLMDTKAKEILKAYERENITTDTMTPHPFAFPIAKFLHHNIYDSFQQKAYKLITDKKLITH